MWHNNIIIVLENNIWRDFTDSSKRMKWDSAIARVILWQIKISRQALYPSIGSGATSNLLHSLQTYNNNNKLISTYTNARLHVTTETELRVGFFVADGTLRKYLQNRLSPTSHIRPWPLLVIIYGIIHFTIYSYLLEHFFITNIFFYNIIYSPSWHLICLMQMSLFYFIILKKCLQKCYWMNCFYLLNKYKSYAFWSKNPISYFSETSYHLNIVIIYLSKNNIHAFFFLKNLTI